MFFFAMLGITLFSANFTLFYYGGRELASGLLSVVFSSPRSPMLFSASPYRAPSIAASRQVPCSGALGVAGMFLPGIIRTEITSTAALGFALCVSGTLLFSLGNIVSTRLQRRGLPVFATSGWSMIYGAALLALLPPARGLPFRIEPTRFISAVCFMSRSSRLGGRRALLFHALGTDRRRPRQVCHGDVSGRGACDLDWSERLSVDLAGGPGSCRCSPQETCWCCARRVDYSAAGIGQVVERRDDVLSKRIRESPNSCRLRKANGGKTGDPEKPSDGVSTRMPGRKPDSENRDRKTRNTAAR